MKIRVDVDCTPEEARAFLGLPDVKPLQNAMMDQMQQRISANMSAMDPEALLKSWFPAQGANLGAVQDLFWSQFSKSVSAMGSASPMTTTEDDEPKDER